ncbi:MAG: lantibiotic dehydratase [Solirubrobacteraceae bacterium]
MFRPAAVNRSAEADFFVLRVPLLSLETLSDWARGTGAVDACAENDERLEQALVADRALLRDRLDRLLSDVQVAEALALGSPDLAGGVAGWRAHPGTKGGRSVELSLVRYLTRLASRPDLFGLAGAYLTGHFGADCRLELRPRSELEVRTQIDSQLLREIVRRTATCAAAESPDLVVRRNPCVYRVGGRLRVAARKPGSTGHRLVEIRPTAAIELALDAARDGASIASLTATLDAAGSPADHTPDLVRRLIGSQLLVPVADVTVTGPEPAAQAAEALESLPGGERYADSIRHAVAVVANASTISRHLIDSAAGVLAATGVEFSRRHCLQVDAQRPGAAQLSMRVLAEMRRGIDVLARITPPQPDALRPFREAFERRYATRSVPLLEALDPDFGIRLGEPAVGEESPRTPASSAESGRRRALLALLDRGRSADGRVELTDADLAALSGGRSAALPGAFAMLARVVGHDADAIAKSDFQVLEPSLIGPSGARLLGRLCRGDEELEEHVREYLAREEALEPDAIFAELSIAPETEVGLNITQRPVLREWEIEYGGGSGAPASRRIEPSDLVVSVENGQVVLWSLSLARRVIPCCTCALNPMWVSLPAARFLLSIAGERGPAYFTWSWDAFADSVLLPRVTRGRTILALRRWNVTATEFADVGPGTDAAGFRRLYAWRLGRALPRVVAFDHPKSRLTVDFGNVLSVEAFLGSTKGLDILRFMEAPTAEQSPVRGPDGHYAHELVVPFTLKRKDTTSTRRRRTPKSVSESRRRFAPGTEWLYANLYGPVAAADRVLVDHAAPLVHRLRGEGLIDRWFFIRYSDPGWHLRVRFHGRGPDLLSEVLPALHEATAPALDEGLLYRISLDTYEREVERYGGLMGVELMEQVAEADSDAVIEILGNSFNATERRHLAVASLAALYADAGLTLERRHACSVQLRTNWAPRGASLGALLGAGERSERANVAAVVAALDEADPEPRVAALRKRSNDLVPILARLRALEEEGILEWPLEQVLCSLAHMSVNRLLKRGANHDELRVHDALARLYEAQIARERSAPPAKLEPA